MGIREAFCRAFFGGFPGIVPEYVFGGDRASKCPQIPSPYYRRETMQISGKYFLVFMNYCLCYEKSGKTGAGIGPDGGISPTLHLGSESAHSLRGSMRDLMEGWRFDTCLLSPFSPIALILPILQIWIGNSHERVCPNASISSRSHGGKIIREGTPGTGRYPSGSRLRKRGVYRWDNPVVR